MNRTGPPPINYATHPRQSQLTVGENQPQLFCPGSVRVTAVPPSPGNQEGLSPGFQASVQQDGLANIQQDGLADTRRGGWTDMQQDGQAYTQQDGHADSAASMGPNESQFHTPFTGSAHPRSFSPDNTPPTPASSLRRPRRPKYYSVTVGKRCSVFSNWSTVSALIIGTSGASYAGFKTAAEAYEDYFNAKAQGYVRVVRDYGDEAIFRPLSLAIM